MSAMDGVPGIESWEHAKNDLWCNSRKEVLCQMLLGGGHCRLGGMIVWS